MEFRSRRTSNLRSAAKSKSLWLFAGCVLFLLFVNPGLAGAAAVTAIVIALAHSREGSVDLSLDERGLRFQNAFIDASMSRDEVRRVSLRGGRVFRAELLVQGECTVLLKSGRPQKRSAILLPDAFDVPLSEVKRAIEEWRATGPSKRETT